MYNVLRYITQCVIKMRAVSIQSFDRSIGGLMARCSLVGQQRSLEATDLQLSVVSFQSERQKPHAGGRGWSRAAGSDTRAPDRQSTGSPAGPTGESVLATRPWLLRHLSGGSPLNLTWHKFGCEHAAKTGLHKESERGPDYGVRLRLITKVKEPQLFRRTPARSRLFWRRFLNR
jgi:hypothetical protein